MSRLDIINELAFKLNTHNNKCKTYVFAILLINTRNSIHILKKTIFVLFLIILIILIL